MQHSQTKQTMEPESDFLLIALTEACQQIDMPNRSPSAPFSPPTVDDLGDPVSLATFFQIDKLGKELTTFIVKDRRLVGGEVRMIRSDNGGSGFYPQFVGPILVRRALQVGSPGAAIEWLRKVLGTTAATGRTIQALWGVPVAGEIQLTSDVKIVPIGTLPDSAQKRRLTQVNNSPYGSVFNYAEPESALVMARQIEPFTFDPETQPNLQNDDYLAAHKLLLDIALALTVVGPRSVISAMKWFSFDDPDLEYALLGSSHSSHMHEIVPSQLVNYPALDPNEAPQIVQGYLALSGTTRDKVRVALQRLDQAQRRRNIGDRAVELSIAFETLLGDDGNTEMTHKIKVRSVRLLGGTADARKRNADVINKTYKIRSQLVHTGSVSAGETETICGERISTSVIIDHATSMCADLIKIIIKRRFIPEWPIFDITEQI